MDINERIKLLWNISEKIYTDPFDNLELIYEVQMNVLDVILDIETLIKSNKEAISVIKKNSKEDEKTIKEKKEISIQIKQLKENNINFKELIKETKEIVDGIVFSLFDQSDIKRLCYKQGVGSIGGKEGICRELEVFKSIFDNGGIAILNDISNSIRFGDITVYNEGLPDLLEIKTSNHENARIRRQKKELEVNLEIIYNDEVENYLGTNIKFKRVHTSNPMKNYKMELLEMARLSYKNGFVHKKLENGLHYIVSYKDMPDESFKKILSYSANFTLYYVNQMKYDTKSNYTPFSLIFNDTRIREDFFDGNIIIAVLLDTKILIDLIEEYGYKAKLTANNEIEVIYYANNEELKLVVSNYNLFRIGREFISLKWFVSSVHDVIVNTKKTTSNIISEQGPLIMR